MAIVFDGKGYSEKKKMLLQASVDLLRGQGIIPHLATLLIGDNPASLLYTNLKKKFIESLGCQVDVYSLNKSAKFEEIELLIKSLNHDQTVHGIMVQFPLPQEFRGKRKEIIDIIDSKKDVDGLKADSKFLHPTAKAAMEVLALAIYETRHEVKTICVIGATGMVGRPLVKELKKLGYIVLEVDDKTDELEQQSFALQSDVLVSATGVMNLITPEMVREGSIVIDVGAPHGDVHPLVEERVSFITPVPRGVGPVTITCLAENLIISAQSTITSNIDAK